MTTPEPRSCGCPETDGKTYHQRGTCTDPAVAALGWYADEHPKPAATPGQADDGAWHGPLPQLPEKWAETPGQAADSFDSPDGRTYSGPVSAPETAPGQAAGPTWLVTDFDGYWKAQGYNPDARLVCSNFGPDDLRDAFGAGMQAARDLAAQEPKPAPASPDLACTVCEATGSPHGVPQPAADVELHVLVAERNQLRMALERLARDGNLEARDSLANILPSRLAEPQPAPSADADRDRYYEALQCIVDAVAAGDAAAVDKLARNALGLTRVGRPQPFQPTPELAADGAPPDVRPRADGRRGLDITCAKCGEDYGTNVPDLDQIECPECGARRCPNCRTWHGGNKQERPASTGPGRGAWLKSVELWGPGHAATFDDLSDLERGQWSSIAQAGMDGSEYVRELELRAAQEPHAAPGTLALLPGEFGGWFEAQGYDEASTFDEEGMAEAFAAGMQAQQDIDAVTGDKPQPAPELAAATVLAEVLDFLDGGIPPGDEFAGQVARWRKRGLPS